MELGEEIIFVLKKGLGFTNKQYLVFEANLSVL